MCTENGWNPDLMCTVGMWVNPVIWRGSVHSIYYRYESALLLCVLDLAIVTTAVGAAYGNTPPLIKYKTTVA